MTHLCHTIAAPLPRLSLSLCRVGKYSCPEIGKTNPTEDSQSSFSACLALLPASACGLRKKRCFGLILHLKHDPAHRSTFMGGLRMPHVRHI